MLMKEEILKEIQKCAKENGDKTPSEKKFYEYAGIGIHDLKKHGWAYYGELVRDADLIPNKFDNTRYSHKKLCKLFIEAIRVKGDWPTIGMLDVRHHKNQKLPDSSTFYNKLGKVKNNALPKTIIEFIKDKQGYDDVLSICNSILEKNVNQDELPGDNDIVSGFVYLGIQNGVHKIGKSKDPNRRREDITLLGPGPFKLIHEIETDDMKGVEKYWHNRFEKKWIRGEWYKLNSFDVKTFKLWRRIV